MMRVDVKGVGVGFCTFALLVVVSGGRTVEAGTEPAGLSVSQTVLRIARSTDGRHFEDTGKVFARHASAADISAVTARYLHASPLTEVFLPNLGRMHKLRARAEASRRATQLAMAVHIFEEEHGHFPQSPDELPAEYDGQMGIDPFTDEPFGYRMDENGPTIYTAGENGIDDRGIHSPRWDDDPVDGSDDIVFWPPQQR